jgi:hypothetical protein
MPTAACGSVKLVRMMKGDACVMLEVAAAITTSGVLLWVAIGAVARASGVRPNPASTLTLSLTTSSWAMRLVMSGALVSSLTITSPSCRPRCRRFAPCTAHGRLDLLAGGGKRAGQRQDQADFEQCRCQLFAGCISQAWWSMPRC